MLNAMLGLGKFKLKGQVQHKKDKKVKKDKKHKKHKKEGFTRPRKQEKVKKA